MGMWLQLTRGKETAFQFHTKPTWKDQDIRSSRNSFLFCPFSLCFVSWGLFCQAHFNLILKNNFESWVCWELVHLLIVPNLEFSCAILAISLRAQGTSQTDPNLHSKSNFLCSVHVVPAQNKPWIHLEPHGLLCPVSTGHGKGHRHPQTGFPVKYFAQVRPWQCFAAVSQCHKPFKLAGRDVCAAGTSFQTCCCKTLCFSQQLIRIRTVTAGRNAPLRNTTSHLWGTTGIPSTVLNKTSPEVH